MASIRSAVRHIAERALKIMPRRTGRGDRLVLSYHNVVAAGVTPNGDRSLHLPIDQFLEQLRIIQSEAVVVPLVELLRTENSSERLVAITFDDAYASALELGVRACHAVNAACTIFVAPGLLGRVPYWDVAASRGEWNDDDRKRFLWTAAGEAEHTPGSLPPHHALSSMMVATESQLDGVATLGTVTLGNHTMRHPNLGAVSPERAVREISDAHRWLEERYSHKLAPAIAYPYGIPPRPLDMTGQLDAVSYGLMVSGGWAKRGGQHNHWAFPRWNIPAGISADGFRLRLRGWLSR